MIADISTCRRLRETAHALGADLPATLNRPLEVYDALDECRRTRRAPKVFSTYLHSGTPVTAKAMSDMLDQAALDHARSQIVADTFNSAEAESVRAFRSSLLAEGGDALAQNLRPSFDILVSDLAQVMSVIPPGTTAEQAIKGGASSLAAWELADDVARRFRLFEAYALAVGRDFSTVTRAPLAQHPSSAQMAFFLDPAAAPDLDAAATAYTNPSSHNREAYRAGPFQALVIAAGKLRLNSVSEAAALVASHEDQIRATLSRSREVAATR